MTRGGVEEKENVKKGRKRQLKGMRRKQGLFRSAPCLILLTSLASVAVAAVFGVCKVLCRCDFPFYERREKKKNPLSISPHLRGGGGGMWEEEGGGCWLCVIHNSQVRSLFLHQFV